MKKRQKNRKDKSFYGLLPGNSKPKSDRLRDLLGNLRKHIYSPMRPFGKAMTYALENARLPEDGYAVWEEEDYCSPPLAQEREAARWMSSSRNSPSRQFGGKGWETGGDSTTVAGIHAFYVNRAIDA